MNQEIKNMLISVAKRYARAFVAGGIASLVSLFAASQFNTDVLKDPQALLISLTAAFLSGGIQAIDKLLRYKESQ
ncbi:MAG: hypothetical protein ACLGJB_03750 [Blastocatellia bacterium]